MNAHAASSLRGTPPPADLGRPGRRLKAARTRRNPRPPGRMPQAAQESKSLVR